MTDQSRDDWLKERATPATGGEEGHHPFERIHDAENKILEEVAASLRKMIADGKPISGAIYIAPNKEICPSCIEAVHRFIGTFGGRINIVLM